MMVKIMSDSKRIKGKVHFHVSILAGAVQFYYRLRIINIGKSTAKNVEVTIRDIRKKKGNSFDRIDFPLDDNLDWFSSSLIVGKPSTTHYKFIFPNTFKHCELGHIIDPSKRNLVSFENTQKLSTADETIFSFNVITRYHSLYHLIGPGTYRVKILVAGENFDLLEREYELEITGKWFEEEERMLSDGLKIKKI